VAAIGRTPAFGKSLASPLLPERPGLHYRESGPDLEDTSNDFGILV